MITMRRNYLPVPITHTTLDGRPCIPLVLVDVGSGSITRARTIKGPGYEVCPSDFLLVGVGV